MIITICGSLKFFEQMVEVQKKLEGMGHSVHMPIKVAGVDYFADDNSGRVNAKRNLGLIGRHMDKINKSDAILVVNVTKKDIENYIGANTFAEMSFAHYRGKKIFVLNPLPGQPYIKDEIQAMDIIALNGDVGKIREA